MRIRIEYRTSRGCDYDDKSVKEYIEDFVNRNADLGEVVNLLVAKGILDAEDVYHEFKTWQDNAGSMKVVDE